ncbi:COP9 signalosome [Lentinula raphanica]|nr:COP9 signalosome [Lentinula raphanica]KAJ3771361.1 COP9 signalosome [Lentinula raphanica]
MANGPPTPPPTTDVEIQDEARMSDAAAPTSPFVESSDQPSEASSSIQPPPPPQSVQQQDSYQLILPKIAELASQKQWLELIHVAEITEINAVNDRGMSRLYVIVPLILAYLIQNDIRIAKLVVERIPLEIRMNPLMRNLRALTTAYSTGAYEQIFSKANTLLNVISQPDFQQPELAQVISIMIDSFLSSFRDRTFLLLSRAYTSLPLALAEMYFGLSANELLPVASRQGWEYDTSTQILKPASTIQPSLIIAPVASSLGNLQFVAQSVSQLEM